MLALPFLVLAYSLTVSALDVAYSLDDQLPTIARTKESYSWAFSSTTFEDSDGDLRYTAADLPKWLAFDASTRTFSGTPSQNDEGNTRITVTAQDDSSSTSSSFTLCVTSYPAPTLRIPITDQFHDHNPSLSSVFLISNTSALSTSNPALRVPLGWSFSIGFEWNTFEAEHNLFYDARQADGSPLPGWLEFNPKQITFNGIAPHRHRGTHSLALHATDQQGYSAISAPFDLVVANHELSTDALTLPTINITASTEFSLAMMSPADFTGILVDGEPVDPKVITDLVFDTSHVSWLSYDNSTRTLAGTPPDGLSDSTTLPVRISTDFGQTIDTEVSLAVVPSYFSTPNISPVVSPKDGQFTFSLVPYFSNATGSTNVNLTASLDPSTVAGFSQFDAKTGEFSASIPSTFDSDHFSITFTAYSRNTHSTSHTTLPVSISNGHRKEGYDSGPNKLSAAAHKRLMLGLSIAAAFVGGIILLGGILAGFRRYARVQDSAVVGEEGMKHYTDAEKRWYGIDTKQSSEAGYGWTEGLPPTTTEVVNPFGGKGKSYDGLSRAPAKSYSAAFSFASPVSSAVMSKREFMSRVKQTVRTVSDKYRSVRLGSRPPRPIIGKPMPLRAGSEDDLPFSDKQTPAPSVNPFDDSMAPGTFVTSPSTSTGNQSIPHRRADMLPPRSPPQVHFMRGGSPLSRELSLESSGSRDSVLTHAAEAVVQKASRAMSVRSGKSMSGVSFASDMPATARPRLVPFNAGRVPVPPLDAVAKRTDGKPRVTSHTAELYGKSADGAGKSTSEEDLSTALQYVESLSVDQRTVGTAPSMLTVSTNVRSSFSSLESSHNDHSEGGVPRGQKLLWSAGQRFKTKVPVQVKPVKSLQLNARLTSGQPLPRFMHADLDFGKHRGAVEVTGTPMSVDAGEYEVGIYVGRELVGVLLGEVVARRG
ncbi:hypothetical protein BD626DRAFT_488440 [Schizophyllum amplum]|uniref:Dystroglycan-type cadherin-like domain-containing protein n=1 Tax=Schizophyllum amplum TaxID=97359 RepID=A0A550CKJ9_9AGAR|nr:hypothetical protein BD626DRAFT_488440 [Auriculariopsis ampla]